MDGTYFLRLGDQEGGNITAAINSLRLIEMSIKD
jgi:hypothetical protein